ncbi:hypothetical protein ACLB2K_009553 [Fragaria x ananassa]
MALEQQKPSTSILGVWGVIHCGVENIGHRVNNQVSNNTSVSEIRVEGLCSQRAKKMGGGHGHGITYKGVTVHQPKRWHTVTGKGLCAVMWFWVLYRAKQDGPVVLGWRHPWEGHDDHGHGHDDHH